MSTSIESKSEQVGSAQSLPEQEYACLPFSVTLPPEKKKKKKKKNPSSSHVSCHTIAS